MIAAVDFLTVPTVNFRVLYYFFVFEHSRRRILPPQVIAHPTSDWMVQHLREAFPFPSSYCPVLLDRDAKFSQEILQFLKSSGIQPFRTSMQSAWQNGFAERCVGSIRRELLDHTIPLNEYRLRRLTREDVAYTKIERARA